MNCGSRSETCMTVYVAICRTTIQAQQRWTLPSALPALSCCLPLSCSLWPVCNLCSRYAFWHMCWSDLSPWRTHKAIDGLWVWPGVQYQSLKAGSSSNTPTSIEYAKKQNKRLTNHSTRFFPSCLHPPRKLIFAIGDDWEIFNVVFRSV